MKPLRVYLLLCSFSILITNQTFAQNPLIQNQFTADPTARVFGDRVYIYPSHDILATEGHGRVGWFCMEDYHVFSSSDLTNWKDHGVIVSQYNVPWVDSAAYSMWAPDCIMRNGKYYFYFPTKPRDSSFGKGFAIGVAVADKPYGPFKPQPEPIKNVHGIDPNVFIDKDGQAYLYWAQGNIYAAKLKDNMLELASEPKVLDSLPSKGLKEGPYLFERNGIYYLTYPHVGNKTERLEYATGDNPMGPFTFKGVIMDESPTGCWTNHHSIIQFKGQWYLFYHHNDLSPGFDKNRSIRADSLFFNPDGSIKKVIPTLRGIGLTTARQNIQIDRYTLKSDRGTTITFLDPQHPFEGWKTILDSKGAWIQYNSVDFGKKALKAIKIRARSETGGTVQIRTNQNPNSVIAEIKIPKGSEWSVETTGLRSVPTAQRDLYITLVDSGKVEIDWVRFE